MFLHTIPFGEIQYARTLIMIQQKSNENVTGTKMVGFIKVFDQCPHKLKFGHLFSSPVKL